MESIVIKTIAFATIAAAAVAAAIFWCTAEPAEAKNYEYCRMEPVTNARQCGFDTMEQCLAMISGRGGSCVRDPFYTDTSAAYAYTPKVHTRHQQ